MSRWFQLQEVRISDRVSALPPPAPPSSLHVQKNRALKCTHTGMQAHAGATIHTAQTKHCWEQSFISAFLDDVVTKCVCKIMEVLNKGVPYILRFFPRSISSNGSKQTRTVITCNLTCCSMYFVFFTCVLCICFCTLLLVMSLFCYLSSD